MIYFKKILWSISVVLALVGVLLSALPAGAYQTAPYAYEVERKTNLPVLVEGEFAEVEVKLRNTGTQLWTAGQVRLVNTRNPYGANTEYGIANDVPPGGAVTFTWQTEAFGRWGVFTSEWQLRSFDQTVAGEPVRVAVIVLPKQLEDKRAELQAQVQEWINQKVENIEAMILAWIQAQLNQIVDDTRRQLCGTPLLPIAAVVAFLIWRVLKSP